MRKILKELLPPVLLRKITGYFYGWRGNYPDWESAGKKCSGYDSKAILEKVSESALKVKMGLAAFERDSVVFNEIEYNYPVVSALLWIASGNNGKLRVLDFGGSLGSMYYQHRFLFTSLSEVRWCIVEQPAFVEEGKRNFADERLKFYYSIEECLKENSVDVILLSSVLPYIGKPYDLLESIKTNNFRYILFNKMHLTDKPDRITIQRVNPAIYRASYPCWFLNKQKFLDFMMEEYELIFGFDNPDSVNLRSEIKGFIFRLREN